MPVPGAWTRYSPIPLVEGRLYSLAILSSIEPIVGCRGRSLPLFHRFCLSFTSWLELSVDGRLSRANGGMTVRRYGVGDRLVE